MLAYYYEPEHRPADPRLPTRRIPPAVGSDTISVGWSSLGASDEDAEKKVRVAGISIMLGAAALLGFGFAIAARNR